MEPVVDLTTNVSQIFTELYKVYNILENPAKNVFEDSLYLEGKQSATIKQRMNDSLIEYHKEEGTIDLYINPKESIDSQVFIAGNGSTQLYKGLVYAIVTSHPDKEFLFVQKIPYFSGHRDAVDKVFNYPNAKYKGYHNPNEIIKTPGLIIVEFVTSPNNPNGEFRKPETNPDIILGDFVFTSNSFGLEGNGYISQNLEWLEEYRAKGTLILSYNSASKQFGHTGDRLGYMWFPLYNDFGASIFMQLNNFLAITVGANLYGSSNFLNLLAPLNKEGFYIRRNANLSLKRRSCIIGRALKKKYPGSIIENVAGSPTMFIKIKDSRINLPDVTAVDVIFEDTKVLTVKGSLYGADNNFVRVNIMAFSEDLNIFVNRLLSDNKYCPDDFIVKPKQIKKIINICQEKYVVNPNDRYLEVDASNNNINIILPKFLGYEPKLKLHVKRLDCSCHKVKIKSELFNLRLKDSKSSHCDCITLVWSQPFYQNGFWSIDSTQRPIQQTYNPLLNNPSIPSTKHLYLV